MYVSFPMYPVNQSAEQVFWRGLKKWLVHFGVAHTPELLSHPTDLHAHWLMPNLLLSQACGYPLVTELKNRIRLVGALAYDAAGCSGIDYRSFIVVRTHEEARGLSDFRHRVLAYNSVNSQSGYNCMRAQIAPLAIEGGFFAATIKSGGHLHSIQMVADGAADIAAIDCVSYAFLKDQYPVLFTKIKVLEQTPLTPGLPLITRLNTSDRELKNIQDALAASMHDDSLADVRSELRIKDFQPIDIEAYNVCLEMQRSAESMGVRVL